MTAPTESYGLQSNNLTPTKTFADVDFESRELMDRFNRLSDSAHVAWQVEYRIVEALGSGGQGTVFLADRIGSFGATFRLALKFFRPDRYSDVAGYDDDMARIAHVAAQLARSQQDHLLDVYNFVEFEGIQVMVMEWVDGYDLHHLLRPKVLDQVRQSVDKERWDYVNDVIVTLADSQLRLKPGVAISVLRELLSGLAALHREHIVHADIKPSNVMIKRTGNCKIIDFGSAFSLFDRPWQQTWTPRYAAVEVLEGEPPTPRSDLASLGYLLFEMLSGTLPFAGVTTKEEMIAAKRALPEQLSILLPDDVGTNDHLVALMQGLIHPDPLERFPTAEAADLFQHGAAEFQKQLVISDLSSEYESEIRHWLEEID